MDMFKKLKKKQKKTAEAAVRKCSSKQVFLGITHYLQENIYVGAFVKKDSYTGVFLLLLQHF